MAEEPITPRRLAQAYRQVFGDADKRTPSQNLVWSDLEGFCHAYRLSVESLTNFDMSENNMLVNEGRRSVWLRARGQILTAQSPEPPPLKVSRKRKT
jgi:hypothetical protein